MTMDSSEQPSLEQSPVLSDSTEFDLEFSEALEEAEITLKQIRDRYQEIKTAQLEKSQLEQTLSHLQRDINQKTQVEQSITTLEAEVAQVQAQIQSLSITLESQLWKWQEPFWQFIRFFGLGFAFAFLLQKLAS